MCNVLTRRGAAAAAGDPPTKHAAEGAPKPSHWRDLHDPATGRLLASRPAGAPAGTWVTTPWWHCVFHDRYERINFWSHAVPGVVFLALGLAAAAGLAPGGPALAVFGGCTAATHLLSALTHVYPDSHTLEKCDHLGIVATIVGTPLTGMMAHEHGHAPAPLLAVAAGLVGSAFLRPLPRVLGFVGLGAVLVALYGPRLATPVFGAELALYLTGALAFLRNGGHSRWPGFSDHHLLHYYVTIAATLHVHYILSALGG